MSPPFRCVASPALSKEIERAEREGSTRERGIQDQKSDRIEKEDQGVDTNVHEQEGTPPKRPPHRDE